MRWTNGRRLLICTVAVTVVAASALSAGTALAAKGGNTTGGTTRGAHGGHTTPPPSTTTLAYAPNPVPVGDGFTLTGTGYAPNTWVVVGFFGSMTGYYVMTDPNGAFAFTWPYTMDWCASYRLDALQNNVTTTIFVDVVGCP